MNKYQWAKTVTEKEIDEVIEEFMDRPTVNVSGVLLSLINVCMLKAEHIRHDWQDEETAKTWEKVAQLIGDNALEKLPNGF